MIKILSQIFSLAFFFLRKAEKDSLDEKVESIRDDHTSFANSHFGVRKPNGFLSGDKTNAGKADVHSGPRDGGLESGHGSDTDVSGGARIMHKDMIPHTANFHPDTDKMLACQCGNEGCSKTSVSQSHLDRTQRAREIAGFGFTVTSGGRCPLHKDEVHRKHPADHQKGNGIDIACNGWNRGLIIAAGIDAGCNAIGVADTFIHLGWRTKDELSGRRLVVWTY